MGCKYCLQINGYHHRMCPNFYNKETGIVCGFCSEYINVGEKYIENDDGDYAHYECLNKNQLIDFLGIKVNEMEEKDELG